MRYLTPGFAVTALRRGRQIEQFLGGIQAGERRGIRWISLSPGREGIGVHLHEVEDVGTDTFWNLTEFPPLDPDDETRAWSPWSRPRKRPSGSLNTTWAPTTPGG